MRGEREKLDKTQKSTSHADRSKLENSQEILRIFQELTVFMTYSFLFLALFLEMLHLMKMCFQLVCIKNSFLEGNVIDRESYRASGRRQGPDVSGSTASDSCMSQFGPGCLRLTSWR